MIFTIVKRIVRISLSEDPYDASCVLPSALACPHVLFRAAVFPLLAPSWPYPVGSSQAHPAPPPPAPPRSPHDCPACRLASTLSSVAEPMPPPVRPWREVKSRRGAPKRLNTEGFACRISSASTPQYSGITDAHIHAAFRGWHAWPCRAHPDVSRPGLPHDVHYPTPPPLVPSENSLLSPTSPTTPGSPGMVASLLSFCTASYIVAGSARAATRARWQASSATLPAAYGSSGSRENEPTMDRARGALLPIAADSRLRVTQARCGGSVRSWEGCSRCQQKKSDIASLQDEVACPACPMTKKPARNVFPRGSSNYPPCSMAVPLGRQIVAITSLACFRLAPEEPSPIARAIRASLRQMVARFGRQMVIRLPSHHTILSSRRQG